MQSSYVGIDPRKPDWNAEELTLEYAALSGNLIVPRTVYALTGGFDEKIVGRGQDGEFTRNLIYTHKQHGLYTQRTIGYHLSHDKDPIWETLSVRRTIKYNAKKYGTTLRPEQLPPLPEGHEDLPDYE